MRELVPSNTACRSQDWTLKLQLKSQREPSLFFILLNKTTWLAGDHGFLFDMYV